MYTSFSELKHDLDAVECMFAESFKSKKLMNKVDDIRYELDTKVYPDEVKRAGLRLTKRLETLAQRYDSATDFEAKRKVARDIKAFYNNPETKDTIKLFTNNRFNKITNMITAIALAALVLT